MFRNQYVVSREPLPQKSIELAIQQVGDLYVQYHPVTHISLGVGERAQVAIIGEILDPFRPEATNEDIAVQLAQTSTSHELFARISELTGRFVCIYLSDRERLAVSDAIALRQIYKIDGEGDDVVFGSSPMLLLRLLGLRLETSPEKLEIIQGRRFHAREHAWLGDGGEDDRLCKVLPNHFLNLLTGEIRRIPLQGIETPSSEDEILDQARRILVGGYKALGNRFTLLQPLTAGLDSRVLLAASRTLAEQVKYYVFDRSRGTHTDATVPSALADKLGLGFEVVTPEPLRTDFKQNFEEMHIYPRLLRKTEDIQYHWLRNRDRNVVNVSTIGAEVARGFYGYSSRSVPSNVLALLSGYSIEDRYFVHAIERWLVDARTASNQMGIPLLDLFYWEQRLGNWGALYPFEQDIAIEEVSVFDNRLLLMSLLRVNQARRAPPDYPMFRDLVSSLWPEALEVPVNPGENRLLGYLKRSPRVRLARMVIRLRLDRIQRWKTK